MNLETRRYIEDCVETLSNRIMFLRGKIGASDKELHFFKAELKALEYALRLMQHELDIIKVIETRIKDRQMKAEESNV